MNNSEMKKNLLEIEFYRLRIKKYFIDKDIYTDEKFYLIGKNYFFHDLNFTSDIQMLFIDYNKNHYKRVPLSICVLKRHKGILTIKFNDLIINLCESDDIENKNNIYIYFFDDSTGFGTRDQFFSGFYISQEDYSKIKRDTISFSRTSLC